MDLIPDLDALKKDTRKLTEFFEARADDQSWALKNIEVMQTIIEHLSQLFIEDNLSFELSTKAAKTIHTHPYLLNKTPHDLTVQLKSEQIVVNALLFSSGSPSFRSLALSAAERIVHLPKVSKATFDVVRQYFENGSAEDLWRHEFDVVLDVYLFAIDWEMIDLEGEVITVLKRYITKQNFQETLIKTRQNRWQRYYLEVLEVANTYDLGVTFHEMKGDFLKIEFLDFRESAMDLFENLKPYITHIGFFGPLNDDPRFSKILLEMPDLYGLSLNEAKIYTDRLQDIPESIEELDLSMNPWITSSYLKFFIEKCPKIKSLTLRSLVNLDFKGFGLLKALQLNVLDLTKCSQIKDEDILLICQSVPHLTHLELEGCVRLTDRSLDALSKFLTKLETLNLSRLQITDVALIDLCHRLKHLHHLNLERCASISDKGIVESVYASHSLRELNISHTPISEGAKSELKTIRPTLHLY